MACMKRLRAAGIEVRLVGLTAGLMTGIHGLTVRPDITLADLRTRKEYRLVIAPGCIQSALSLLVDPRVHELMAATMKAGGRVAVMGEAEEAFVQAGRLELLARPGVVAQGKRETNDFVSLLVKLATA